MSGDIGLNIETFYNTDGAKRFFFPGKIFVGKGMASNAAEVISNYSSVAIVVDRAFAASGIRSALERAVVPGGVRTWVVEGAPFVQDIMQFIAQLPAPPAAVVSIGGGSAADFAKAIILHELFGTIDGIGIGNKRGLRPRPGSRRPVYIAIPTTAGSGAEASRYYVTYDKRTHGKVYGKTWEVIADWIFLDPECLATMPVPALVGCAFDAFVHLFETLVARHERSLFGEMLSLDGIPRIMEAVDAVVFRRRRDDLVHEALMHSATLAGIAISNVRTGHIHEAAGALLELTELSHPETLFVFFRNAVEHYLEEIRDRERELIPRLRLKPAFSDFASLEDVISWWERVFAEVGLEAKIRFAIAGLGPSLDKARAHIFERVYSDKVWIAKESPLPLDKDGIDGFIDRSLARFR